MLRAWTIEASCKKHLTCTVCSVKAVIFFWEASTFTRQVKMILFKPIQGGKAQQRYWSNSKFEIPQQIPSNSKVLHGILKVSNCLPKKYLPFVDIQDLHIPIYPPHKHFLHFAMVISSLLHCPSTPLLPKYSQSSWHLFLPFS